MPAISRNAFTNSEVLIEDLFDASLIPGNWQALLDAVVHSRPRCGAALVWRAQGSTKAEIISAGLNAKSRETLREMMISGDFEAAVGRIERAAYFVLDIASSLPAVLYVACRSGDSTKLASLRQSLSDRQTELKRAFVLLDCYSGEQRALDRLNRLLEARAAPTLIVNDTGEILAANVRARSTIAEAKILDLGRDGRLWLKTSGTREPVSKALSGIDRPVLLGLDARKPRGEGLAARDLLVVIPLPEAQTPFPSHGREFVLTIRNLFQAPSIVHRGLETSFGLTQAEARLVAALASGLAIGRYARDSRIKESTARWHVRNALEKTGCKTQTDLIRLAIFLESW
jgi:DNA-binding CsgD family transcriptional regulator